MRISTPVSLLTLAIAMPALAQDPVVQSSPETASQPAPPPMSEGEVDAIVVTAERIRGQVQTASAPVITLDQQQVQAYGATSIADLVAQLSPQVGSGRGRGGRPVILVNGQRVSNFREIGRYPPESIRKVEVLPEEVALKYGYRADQRVINFILQDNFASREAELELGMPTRGGYAGGEGELGLLRISGTERLNATLGYSKSTPLTEAERAIEQTAGSVPTVATDPDPAAFRTLVARREQIEGNVTATKGLGEAGAGGLLTLNSQWVHSSTESLSGLDLLRSSDAAGNPVIRTIDDDPIARRTNTDTLSLGAGYSARLGEYQFQTTFDGSLTDTESLIDRRRTAPGPVVQDLARSKVWSAALKSTFIGTPVDLPAGGLGITLNAAYDWDRIDSFDTRTVQGNGELTRGTLSASGTVIVPIASRRDDVWAAIGDLTFTLGGGVEHLSDFGTLGEANANLVWKPFDPLTVQANYTVRETAPGLSQLGGPTIQSFNVPVYDFRLGETALITQTSGGNPFLLAERQRDLKLSASYDIPLLEQANVLVEYYRNRSENVTSGFPLLTPEIEAAFPGRVTRDAAGRLVALDVRPVTFTETRSERLRYGFNLFGKLGKPLPPGQRSGGGGIFGALMGGRPASPAATPGAAGSTPAAAPQVVTMGGFDPARLAELRTKFCAAPEGTIPDLSALPQPLQERLKGEDGQVDPARVAVMRQRFCSADAAQRFDPARFAAMRQSLCADPAAAPDPAAIPEEIRNRLKGPDGTIAPERLKEFQTRICALPSGQQRGQASGESGGTGQQADRGAAPEGRRGGGGGGSGGPGGDGQGRWNVSLYHTVNLSNEVLIAPGGPALDLMDGDATGSGGGVPRHQFELEGGAFYRGIGLRLSGSYAGATRVRGTGLPGSSELLFGDLATFNLRAFVALDQQKWLVGDEPGFFRQARLSLRVNNIFDTRQRVTDADGLVPIRYQPFLIDPIGRFVEIEFRKLF